LVKLVGAEKVALGTDYPFPLGEEIAGSLIESMNYDDATNEKLLHKTALDWLDLNIKRFE
jgi:aminocarboxymuconate-semialdehyde decarboxylase